MLKQESEDSPPPQFLHSHSTKNKEYPQPDIGGGKDIIFPTVHRLAEKRLCFVKHCQSQSTNLGIVRVHDQNMH